MDCEGCGKTLGEAEKQSFCTSCGTDVPTQRKRSQSKTPNIKSAFGLEISREGYLEKLSSGAAKQWKKRYFALAGQYLNYTHSKEDVQKEDSVRESINLKDATSLMISATQITLYVTTGEKYEFRADNTDEAREWADDIAFFTPDGFAIDSGIVEEQKPAVNSEEQQPRTPQHLLSVSVAEAETLEGVTKYTINIARFNMQWSVQKRYSEFDTMHTQLKTCNSIPQSMSKDFPNKTLFFITLTPEDIEARRKQLDKFMKQVVELRHQSEDMQFMDVLSGFLDAHFFRVSGYMGKGLQLWREPHRETELVGRELVVGTIFRVLEQKLVVDGRFDSSTNETGAQNFLRLDPTQVGVGDIGGWAYMFHPNFGDVMCEKE
jgi:hypothetical protein